MIVKVLGSAAGGGFPQWNCNTSLSRLAWRQERGVKRRTQSSIAVSADGENWTIVNASPDIRQQIFDAGELQPYADGPLRHSPISDVIVTNADVDHIAGLLSLRERQPFTLRATSRVLDVIARNSIFNVLAADVVERRVLSLGATFTTSGAKPLKVRAFPVPGKVALFLEDVAKGTGFGTEDGDTVGLEITAPGSGRLLYIPGCAAVDARVLARAKGADMLLFDGTVYTDGEMAEAGVGDKTGRRMGHAPISGEGGSLHAFDGAGIARKAYIHINTTNPITLPGSEPESEVRAAGWDVAFDGMTITL